MATCQYYPLPPETPQTRGNHFTRLIHLHPGLDPQPFSCKFEYTSISSAPVFEALSYHWGHETASTPLWCDNGWLPIRRNLDQALRHLRLPNQSRRLWVDAVCINQSDVAERSRQVGYMRQIYQRARRVIVWLGLKCEGLEEGVTLALQLVEYRRVKTVAAAQTSQSLDPRSTASHLAPLGSSSTTIGPTNQALGPLDSQTVDSMALQMLQVNESAVSHLLALFSRAYFSRIWCIQEVLGSSYAVAKFEDLEYDLMDIRGCATYLHYHQSQLCTGQTLEFWGLLYAIKARASMASEVPGSLGPLLNLLTGSRDFEASDPRDKVFTMLGISDEGLEPVTALSGVMGDQATNTMKPFVGMVNRFARYLDSSTPDGEVMRHPAMKPDYAKSVVAVYRDFTRFQVRMAPRLLTVLSYVSHDEDPRGKEFPSWVPKWNEKRTTSAMVGCFAAGLTSKRKRYFARVHDNPLRGHTEIPEVLRLDGFRFDRVQLVGGVMAHELQKPIFAAKIWTEMFGLLYRFPSGLPYCLGDDSLEMAFHTTLAAGPLGAFLGILADQGPDLPMRDKEKTAAMTQLARENAAAVIEWHTSHDRRQQHSLTKTDIDEAERRELLPWDVGARSLSHNRCVFITATGRLGLGPKVMREGDEVVVLYGGRLPFVLRHAGDHHLFIGDAYVHDEDLMWGKMVDAVDNGTSTMRNETFGLR